MKKKSYILGNINLMKVMWLLKARNIKDKLEEAVKIANTSENETIRI